MSRLRETKDRARTLLHDRMKVESYCFADGDPDDFLGTVWLRVNSDDKALGDLAGTSLAYAERRETVPKLIFLADEHDPQRGHVYVVGPEEAYKADTVDPRDGITVTVHCSRLSKKDAVLYDYPGD